jgi:AcrR family transcriptional regulator
MLVCSGMPRRSAAAAADTRAALISAGRKLFGERGFAGASTGEISAAARVTEGALFHHFGGKKDLFSAVFEQLEAELVASAEAAAFAARKGDPLDAFPAGCRVYPDFAERTEFSRIVMIDGPAVLGVEGWRERDSVLGLATMARGIDALMKAGAIERQPVKPLAVLIFGALNEVGLALARGEPGVSSRQCLAALRRLMTAG